MLSAAVEEDGCGGGGVAVLLSLEASAPPASAPAVDFGAPVVPDVPTLLALLPFRSSKAALCDRAVDEAVTGVAAAAAGVVALTAVAAGVPADDELVACGCAAGADVDPEASCEAAEPLAVWLDAAASDSEGFAAGVSWLAGTDAGDFAPAPAFSPESSPVMRNSLACQSPEPVAKRPFLSHVAMLMTEFLWPCSEN